MIERAQQLSSHADLLLGISSDPFGLACWLACCLLTPLAVPLQAVFVMLPLTATRTVLSRVVSDPRARHRALLRRGADQAGVSAPSRAHERKAALSTSLR
jgi:hypothetical protein